MIREWQWTFVLWGSLLTLWLVTLGLFFSITQLLASGILGLGCLSVVYQIASNKLTQTADLPASSFLQLGVANHITLARAFLVSLVATFIFFPNNDPQWLWLPAILYTVASFLDALDGFVAKRTQTTTELGKFLDMECDALGILVACAVAISWQRLPLWYVLTGCWRYLFVLGLWWRQHKGLPVYPLPPSECRRNLAGGQMVLLFISLYPIFSPSPLSMIAGIFFIFFTAMFARDWLLATTNRSIL